MMPRILVQAVTGLAVITHPQLSAGAVLLVLRLLLAIAASPHQFLAVAFALTLAAIGVLSLGIVAVLRHPGVALRPALRETAS